MVSFPEMEIDNLDYPCVRLLSRNTNSAPGSNCYSNLEPNSELGSNCYSSNLSNYSSGGTVLQGKSDQRFNMVNKIKNIDTKKITTLQLRLVCKDGMVPVSKTPPRIESLYGNNIRSYNEIEPKI